MGRHLSAHGLVLLSAAAQAGAVSLNERAHGAAQRSWRALASEAELRSARLLSERQLSNRQLRLGRTLSSAEAAVDQTDAVVRYLSDSVGSSAVMVDFAGAMQRPRQGGPARSDVNLESLKRRTGGIRPGGRGPPVRLSAARGDHPWSWEPFNTTGCQNTGAVPGAVPLTYDECRATALMDSLRHETEALTLGDPFGVTSSGIPAGCSFMLVPNMPGVPPMVYYNFDPVGGAAAEYSPICKEPGYTMFAGGCPPPMFISLPLAECQETAELFAWPWGSTLEEAGLPAGCFGKDGFMYFNRGVNGVGEFHLGTDAFSICKAPTAGDEPNGFVAPEAEPPPGMFAPADGASPTPPDAAAPPPPFNSFAPGAGAPSLPGSEGPPAAQAPVTPWGAAAPPADDAAAQGAAQAPTSWIPDWALPADGGLGAATGAATAADFDPVAPPADAFSGAAAAPPAPGASGASAVGDPHMTSVTGAKFDLARAGNHTLLHIPRFSEREERLLDVGATVKHEGPTCLDMYIDSLRITGKWADDKRAGGISFSAGEESQVGGHWLEFGKLQLKVVHGTTVTGVKYLNVLLKHLTKVGMPMGGILGLDDHTEAATPEEHCRRSLSL